MEPSLTVRRALRRVNTSYSAVGLTSMISNNSSWSTCMNFWSHSGISDDFFRASDSSSGAGGGSFRWCSHHSITFLSTASLT